MTEPSRRESGPHNQATSGLPPYIFLYGLVGAGKSYCGEVIAARTGAPHHDLDRHITGAMKEAIRAGRPFSEEERNEFFALLEPIVQDAMARHPRAVFSQGAYKERHREAIRIACPGIEFVCVSAPAEVLLQRLSRRAGSVGADYADAIARNFEPGSAALVLLNDGAPDDELFGRLVTLFKGNGICEKGAF